MASDLCPHEGWKPQAQTAQLMDRHKSTISRVLARNTGNRSYHLRRTCFWQRSALRVLATVPTLRLIAGIRPLIAS